MQVQGPKKGTIAYFHRLAAYTELSVGCVKDLLHQEKTEVGTGTAATRA